YDEQLAQTGAELVRYRVDYLKQVSDRFAATYQAITRSGSVAELRYATRTPTVEAIREALHAGLRTDLARGFTGAGPHADDLEILLQGRAAKLYGSQGQLRAIMLAFKIAEVQLLDHVHDEPAVLLLDDVSSELDPERNKYLFEFINEI